MSEKCRKLPLSYFLGVALPFFLFVLILKIVRVNIYGYSSSLMFLDYIKSDLLLITGITLMGLGLFHLLSRAKKGISVTVFVLLQSCFTLFLAIEFFSHNFFIKTGSILDYKLVEHTVSHLQQLIPLLSREGDAYLLPLSIISLLLFWALPWFIYWKSDKIGKQRYKGRNIYQPVTFLLLAFFAFSASALPFYHRGSSALAKNSVVNLLESYREFNSENAENYPDVRKAPLEAKLEPLGNIHKRNLAIILLESTRYTGTSLGNPKLKNTPYLAKLAKKSLFLQRAYAVVPHTSKALIAILCGIEPWLVLNILEARSYGIPARSISHLLKDQGYSTVFFQNATGLFERRKELTKNLGFDETYTLLDFDLRGYERCNYFGFEEDVMLPRQDAWLEKHKDRPFLFTVLTLSPHDDYQKMSKYGFHQFAEDKSRVMYNRYLNSIHYLDNYTRKVINLFKKHGLYENTIFLIMGDHGEGFDEHNVKFHDNTIWDEGLRVPMIIHDPRRFQEGHVIERPVNELDLLPTLTHLLGYEIKNARYPGSNMLWPRENYTLFASCWYERKCMASLKDDIKYIHHYGKQPDEVYNLVKDPLEKNNLYDSFKEKEERLKELKEWKSGVNAMYRAHVERWKKSKGKR